MLLIDTQPIPKEPSSFAVSEPPLSIARTETSTVKVEDVVSPLPVKQHSVEYDRDTSDVELARLFTDILVQ